MYSSFKFLLLLCLSFLFACTQVENAPLENHSIATDIDSLSSSGPVLVIHGGAGSMQRKNFSTEQEKQYRTALNFALTEGFNLLKNGGTASEAVIKAIQILEADSLFNAGVGAVLTHEKTVSLDASFMDGATGQAGAVSGINKVKSPIELAYTIMNYSPHVMLSGKGAEQFAELHGLASVAPEYFITQSKLNQINKVLSQKDSMSLSFYDPNIKASKMGTVGAVALDQSGNLAAGTSTGGMTNKKHGRIGDSPIIGAGTYADNASCAVSATGHGEFFIRNVVAYDIAAQMKYKNLTLKEAAQTSIDGLSKLDGLGGVIALDRKGNIAMPFNTNGMFRAYAKANGEVVIELFD